MEVNLPINLISYTTKESVLLTASPTWEDAGRSWGVCVLPEPFLKLLMNERLFPSLWEMQGEPRPNRIEVPFPAAFFIWKNIPQLMELCHHGAPPLLGLCPELSMQYVFKVGLKFARLTSNLHSSCFSLLNAEIIDTDPYAWLFNTNSHQHIGAKMIGIILGLRWHGLGREVSLGVDMEQRWLSTCGRKRASI